MKKAMNKIIVAAVALVAALGIATGTTFAWFSMNNTVTVTGMQVKTVVSSNLLIDNYANGSWATNDSTFKATDTQSITSGNVLAPVSTVNGINYFYTANDNVKGDGDAIGETYVAVDADFTNLNTAYGSNAGYLDYHFVLKAQNTSEAAQKIVLTELNLTYSGATDGNKAFRVAVLAKKFETAVVNGAKTAPGLPATATKIYAPDGATNFESGKAVTSTTATGAVTYASTIADSEIASVAANETEYYEVTVRLWLEGEDNTCNVNVFKGLTTGRWSLDIAFKLQNDTTGGKHLLNMAITPGA